MNDFSHERRMLERAIAPAPFSEADGGAWPCRLSLPRIRVHAFLSDADDIAAASALAADRRAKKATIDVAEGGFDAATERCRAVAPPDIIIVEHLGDAERLPGLVDALAEHCPHRTRLIVVGDRNDVSLYRDLIRHGVAEYLVRPVTPSALLEAILEAIDETDEAERLGSIFAFVGARGGVGSSTIAQNAAATLSRIAGGPTILIDADIGFGAAAMLFDAQPPFTLADALRERDNLTAPVLERIVHWPSKDFGLLAAPSSAELTAPPEPGRIQHIVEVSRRLGRHVVVDLPTGLAPWSGEVLEVADEIVVVASPDLVSLRNARSLTAMLRQARPHDRPPRIVLSRVRPRAQTVPRGEFERILGAPVAAEIPESAAAAAAEFDGRTLFEAERRGGAAVAIEALAGLLGGLPQRRPNGRNGWLGRLGRRR